MMKSQLGKQGSRKKCHPDKHIRLQSKRNSVMTSVTVMCMKCSPARKVSYQYTYYQQLYQSVHEHLYHCLLAPWMKAPAWGERPEHRPNQAHPADSNPLPPAGPLPLSLPSCPRRP